ncbi:hypothetical protein [Laspinema olomoucense]|uniref:Obg domain-containing protein n=1 Tax=Laspinema olomoucense D3b TaxID=2953688 RepID=A0ABT2NCV4_9CYAN|nr:MULTISPECIES: hypothetical protein [unclassified Laspinema]MCT7980311.1 hypothetical protein [Laspinema sp. D3b]MCT7993911.1 hypothetical protein [Laspinema sp. D3c]
MTFVIISGGTHPFACCNESTQVLTLVEKKGNGDRGKRVLPGGRGGNISGDRDNSGGAIASRNPRFHRNIG